MSPGQRRNILIGGLAVLCVFWICVRISQIKPDTNKASSSSEKIRTGREQPASAANTAGMNQKEDTDFPINDSMELPFIGKVRCHVRQEKMRFSANGKQKEWPFKVYYLPGGMFVRAEFTSPGRKDYELTRAKMETLYRARAESLAGFPEKAAPVSLGKVLQSLYENEPFDTASKINITWVLREGTDGVIRPYFIANIWGVSSGFMQGRVPEDDERFLKTRIILSPEGVALRSDNIL